MKKALLTLMLTLSLGLPFVAFASAQRNLPISNGIISPGAVGSAKLGDLSVYVVYNITCQLNTKNEGIYLAFDTLGVEPPNSSGPYYSLNGQDTGYPRNQVVLQKGTNTLTLSYISTWAPDAAINFRNLDDTSPIELSSCKATPAV